MSSTFDFRRTQLSLHLFILCLCNATHYHHCLFDPTHTTHCLQPCDVGVFGPLNSCWKAQVNAISRQYIHVTKSNLLRYYHTAREKAFTKRTIKSAFWTTGIHPFNPDIIEDDAFAPALNTTTHAAQPVPAALP
ncbi:hypothetical protein L208DRAFT_1252526, partial [Tricholoma matsutake]